MDYIKMMKERNEKNYFAKHIGIEIIELSLGYAKVQLQVSEHVLNPIQSVHGGCLFTMADIASGAAANSYEQKAATLDSTFHYLKPALNTKTLFATTKEIKRGKRVLVYQVFVTDQDEQILAEGMFTYMVLSS